MLFQQFIKKDLGHVSFVFADDMSKSSVTDNIVIYENKSVGLSGLDKWGRYIILKKINQ